jgi:hypothetical protein
MRRVLASFLCLWLAFAGAGVQALEVLEDEHQQEHMAMGDATHDPTEHRHADEGVELFSALFAKIGFAQLGAAWIASQSDAVMQPFAAVAAEQRWTEGFSFLPAPPPGPPPRLPALHRGG